MQLLWKSLGLSPCDAGAQWGVLSREEARSGPGLVSGPPPGGWSATVGRGLFPHTP